MPGTIGTAFVLGAGLGTRLRPLTDGRPKPLVPLFGKPLITFAFDHAAAFGAERFVVNTHHRPEAYETLLGARAGSASFRNRPITLRHEPTLLDTGGGVANVRDLVGAEPFLVHNGDVLADLPLDRLIRAHHTGGHVATLALRSRGGPLQVQLDPASGRVTDIRKTLGGRDDPAYLFTGIAVMSPEIFDHMPDQRVFSIVAVYLDMIRRGVPVGGVVLDDGLWFDLGTRASYLEAHRLFSAGGKRLSYPLDRAWPEPFVAPSARIGEGARIEGISWIGADAEIGAGAHLIDTIVWENAKIASRVRLEGCIVRDGRPAGENLTGADL